MVGNAELQVLDLPQERPQAWVGYTIRLSLVIPEGPIFIVLCLIPVSDNNNTGPHTVQYLQVDHVR